jgi:sugar lactone lactonase YvrE
VLRSVTTGGLVQTYQSGYVKAESVRLGSDGKLYVADATANVIWRSPAASGAQPSRLIGAGGSLTTVGLDGPEDAIEDGAGNVYISNTGSNTVLRVGSNGTVDAVPGFSNPVGLALVAPNMLYVADSDHETIRLVDFSSGSAMVSIVAGQTNTAGLAEATNGSNARFDHPFGLFFDAQGQRVLVAERTNNTIRAIAVAAPHAVTGIVSGLVNAHRVAYDGTTYYIADASAVRTADSTGAVSPLAGNLPNSGHQDGDARDSLLDAPNGLAVGSDGSIYIAEAGEATVASDVRRIANGSASSCSGTFEAAFGVATSGTTIFVSDGSANVVESSAACTGSNSGFVPISEATATPLGLATSGSSLFVADGSANDVTMIGGGTNLTLAFGGAVQAIAVAPDGTICAAEPADDVIECRNSSGGSMVVTGTRGSAGFAEGSGAVARFDAPAGIAIDPFGNVYVADQGNAVIRKITPSGQTSTIAGAVGDSGIVLGTGSASRLSQPSQLAIDGSDLLVTDQAAVLRIVGAVGM